MLRSYLVSGFKFGLPKIKIFTAYSHYEALADAGKEGFSLPRVVAI